MSKAQTEWSGLPTRDRVKLALVDKNQMGFLFDYVRLAGLFNMSGSAYRTHPQCLFRQGVLLVDHWKTWGDYEIWIANKPKEIPARGCQDSMSSSGNPYPTIESGWTIVWSRGRFVKEGPWCGRITEVLATLVEEADQLTLREELRVEAVKQEAADKAAREDAALRDAWENPPGDKEIEPVV